MKEIIISDIIVKYIVNLSAGRVPLNNSITKTG